MKKNNNIQEYQKKYDRKEGWNQTKVILANEIKIKNKLYGQFCKTANQKGANNYMNPSETIEPHYHKKR